MTDQFIPQWPRPKNLEDAVRQLRAVTDDKEATEERLKQINKQREWIQTSVLPQMMEAQGVTSFKVPSIGTVSLGTETYVSVAADDRPQLLDWLRETGNGSLISEQVHHQTLTSFTKEMLEQGSDVPDIVKVTLQLKAKLRRT